MFRTYIDELLEDMSEQELERVYYDIERVRSRLLFERQLAKKAITIELVNGDFSTEEVVEKWDKTFATISNETKKSIFYDSFRWHMYSYEQLPALCGQEAREAFNAVAKSNLYFMYDRHKGMQTVQIFEHAGQMVAADLDEQQDIYVFDNTFTWCYIHTHEEMCGPYFVKA